MSQFLIFADGQISINGNVTPYYYRRVEGSADEFWRAEDRYFGTTFKRIKLPKKKYSAADVERLVKDITKAIKRDGWNF